MLARNVVLIGADNAGKKTLIQSLRKYIPGHRHYHANIAQLGYIQIENCASIAKENNKRERERRIGLADYIKDAHRIIFVIDPTQETNDQKTLIEQQWQFLSKKPASIFVLFTKKDLYPDNEPKLNSIVTSLQKKLDCQVQRLDLALPINQDNKTNIDSFIETIQRDQLKHIINLAMREYISVWKICLFGYGHHHNSRAKAVLAAINRCIAENDLIRVANILSNQIAIMDGDKNTALKTANEIPNNYLTAHWKNSNELKHAKTNHSGYYKSLVAAKNALDKLPLYQNQNKKLELEEPKQERRLAAVRE